MGIEIVCNSVQSHDLAAPVDTICLGYCGTRDVDRGKAFITEEKSVGRASGVIPSNDLARIIDTRGRSKSGAGKVYRCESERACKTDPAEHDHYTGHNGVANYALREHVDLTLNPKRWDVKKVVVLSCVSSISG